MPRPLLASVYSQPLGGRRIRLLNLSSSLPGEPLQGHLTVVSLDRRLKIPTYDALSYVWGEDSDAPSRHLSCSDVDIPITQNCYDALSSLYCHFGVRTIWVDSICINQADSEVSEKEQQILLMKDIYSQARRVFIWLGKGTRESDEAFTWIAEESNLDLLVMVRQQNYPAFLLPRALLRSLPLIPMWIDRRVRLIKRRLWSTPRPRISSEAIQDVVGRPWFRRMWTLQELVLANEPHVVCGTKSLRYNHLYDGIKIWANMPENMNNQALFFTLRLAIMARAFWLYRSLKVLYTEGHSRTWIQGDGMKARAWQRFLDYLEGREKLLLILYIGLAAAIAAVHYLLGPQPFDKELLMCLIITFIITRALAPAVPRPIHGTRLPWEVLLRQVLPRLMNRVRDREAKHPVDKAFALHGLFRDFDIPLEQPDYSTSMGQVYLEFTCALIQWHEPLNLLAEVSAPGIPGLPTWVPDWNRRHYCIWTDTGKAAGNFAASFAIVNDVYEDSGLSGHTKEEFQWTPQLTRINLGIKPRIITKGFIDDKIETCLPPIQKHTEPEPFQHESSPSSALLNNIEIFLYWLDVLQKPGFSSHQSPSTISETLYTILHWEVLHRPNHRAQFEELFCDWMALLRRNIASFSRTKSIHVARCARGLQANLGLYDYYIGRCNALAGKRIIFTTQKGRLGTGVLGVQKGDAVALISGNGYPMILRRNGDGAEYQVVGTAYVEGMMHGEAWRGENEGVGELVLV